MSKGKLIIIEGTDCSGKETQSNLLIKRLKESGYKVAKMSFPNYDSPTGKIIGACLLGKPHMVEELLKTNSSFFKEGGGNVDSLAACDLYAADRRYNLPILNELLDENEIVIVDRYVSSNMAHRGGLLKTKKERLKIYDKIDKLEYDINELPRPDKVFLLYLPFKYAEILKKNRAELPDEAEKNTDYLKRGEAAYLELADIYNYDIIDCVSNNLIKSIEDINNELFDKIVSLVKK